MESHSYDSDLAVALTALRPTPRPEFAAELDARAAEGFPRHHGESSSRLGRLAKGLRATPPRRLLLPAGGVAVIAASEHSSTSPPAAPHGSRPSAAAAENPPHRPAPRHPEASSGSGDSSGVQVRAGELEESAPTYPGPLPYATPSPVHSGPYAFHSGHRDVEREASIVLSTDASEVRQDAARVFEAVHAANGIVLHSTIRDGSRGAKPSASFDLLIPTARLSDALAAFSGIAEVRSRHESAEDITAPTVGVGERLRDSRARVEGLLAQLAGAETDSERAATEVELRAARRRAAALRSRLFDLQRRANLSHVSLRIETGKTSAGAGGGGWGVSDGFNDAGRILAIALLAWLARRAYLRRARHTALERA
jgi:Domain of unknown function (DUF4349)